MLHIILNEIRSFFRSGPTVFISLFFPSICTFILGTMLEKVETADGGAVGELNIVYCIESESILSDSFENFLSSLEEENVLTAEKASTEIPENFTEDFSAAVIFGDTEITVLNGKNQIQNRTVKALIDGYDRTAAAYMTAARTNPQALFDIEISENSDGFTETGGFGKNRTMMDYYAVSMTILIIFFSSLITGSSSYGSERANCTLDRLNTAPVNKLAVYIGKVIGNVPAILAQVAVVMIISSVFFGAHFCSAFSGNLLLFAMFVSCSLALLTLGILLDMVIPGLQPQAAYIPVLWVMLFFSGIFQKDISIEGLTEYLPPRIMLNAAFDLTVFSRTEKAVSVMMWSFIIFALLFCIGALKVNARRKKV